MAKKIIGLIAVLLAIAPMVQTNAAKPECAGRPTITSVSPASGDVSGGTTVNIAGTCFEAGLNVNFDSSIATLISVTDGLIVVTSPAHAAGTVAVHVKHSTGNATANNAFTYIAPVPVPTLNVIFDSQGGSPVAPTTVLQGGTISSAPANPELFGYTFVGWATTTTGSVITFPYSPPNISDFTLYAIWQVNATEPHKVTFDGNGATGGSTAQQTSTGPALLSANGFTREGFTWHGWVTAPIGGVEYEAGDTYPFTTDAILYAEWSAVVVPPVEPPATPASSGGRYAAPNFQIIFDGNESDGLMANAQVATNNPLPPLTFTKPGYNFDHWSTSRTIDGILFDDNDPFTLAADTTLYAHWQPKVAINVLANQPINLPIKGNEAVAIGVHVQVPDTKVIYAIVDIPQGVATISSAIRITPLATDATVDFGIVNMRVEIFDANGKLFPTLLVPIKIHFMNELGNLTVATSNNSLHWTSIPLLVEKTLPVNQADGYYTNLEGTIVVITNHLSMFSFKKNTLNLLVTKSSKPLVTYYQKAKLSTSGSNGTSAIYYESATPYICSVDRAGNITPLQSGTCTMTAMQDSDGVYFNSSSAPVSIKVSYLNYKLNVTGEGATRRIGVALTAKYANKLTHIEVLKPGANQFILVKHLILNENGKNSFNLAIEPNTVVRAVVDGEIVSTYLHRV
ncbi:MAG: hypothetical protein RL129_664 [Actinomycetota bacterium]